MRIYLQQRNFSGNLNIQNMGTARYVYMEVVLLCNTHTNHTVLLPIPVCICIYENRTFKYLIIYLKDFLHYLSFEISICTHIIVLSLNC